ncbi:hypothetical protein ACFMQL_30380 [Nonomuraea fastidiosa]|uniref:hypothetical protein n=1 Tax=Nonomuraea fastidiosa TaxID=46173 RepID=UPI00367096AD
MSSATSPAPLPCAPAAARAAGAPSAAAVLRLARAVVFATVCGAVSAGGHVLAGGGPVPLPVYLAAVLATLTMAYLADGRERGLGAVLAATAGTQTLLHQIFERLAPGELTGHVHGHAATGMMLVHLTVAALTAWWLHRGERALWLIIRLYGIPLPATRLLVTAPAVAEPWTPAWRPATPEAAPRRGRLISRAISRRGPPVLRRH